MTAPTIAKHIRFGARVCRNPRCRKYLEHDEVGYCMARGKGDSGSGQRQWWVCERCYRSLERGLEKLGWS